MRNRFLLMAVVLLLLVSAVAPASAGYIWCLTDPNILLPDGGGVVHLVVGTPKEYKGVPFVLDVWAPAGSRVVGSTHGINVVLHEGPAKQITATANASFPVMLFAKYKGQILPPGNVYFLEGSGAATWTW